MADTRKALDLLAGQAGNALNESYRQRLAEQQTRMADERAHVQRMFEARQNVLKTERERAMQEDKQAHETQLRTNLEKMKGQARENIEQMGIKAGKYDKTGRYAWWSSLKLDPKYKAILGIAESNVKELSDILASSNYYYMEDDQKKGISDQIKFYQMIQQEAFKKLDPTMFSKVYNNMGLQPPKPKPIKPEKKTIPGF